MNPQNRSHLGVLLSYLVISILVTWPLAMNFTTGVPFGGDAFQFVWNGWWFSKAVSDPNLVIWWTPYQYALVGSSLALHDLSPLNAFIQMLLIPILGDFGAFNFLTLFHYVLGAWGAYILAFYLTGNRAGSVICGVIYGFSVHHAMHMPQLSTCSGWLPLSVYYSLKFARDGGWRDGLLGVLTILAAILSNWYYLVFTGFMVFGIMLIGQAGLREHLGGTRRWGRVILIFAVSVLVTSPLIINAWLASEGQGIGEVVELGKLFYFDPAWTVLPPPNHPVLGALTKPLDHTIPGNLTEGITSMGFVAVALGILSWFRIDATTRAWCWMGTILFLLALGATITLLSVPTPIPGPFVLWSKIPGLSMIRIPARFIGPFTLALGVCAAGWVGGLSSAWRGGWRRTLILWIIPAAIIFETLVIPIPIAGPQYSHPALERLPEIYAEYTGNPEPPTLIVNFPLLPKKRQFLYQQTIHELPTLDGALSYEPPDATEYLARFNWNPEYLREVGVDIVLYQSWAAKSSLGETFHVPPDATGNAAQWADQNVEPLVFFRDVMQYGIAYEDDELIVFVP